MSKIRKWLAVGLVFLLTVSLMGFSCFASDDDVRTYGELKYKITDGHAVITGVTDPGKYKKFEIPDEIDGYPVTTIGTQAFSGCKKLLAVEIPENITVVEDEAFLYCFSLNYIKYPESITYIGRGNSGGSIGNTTRWNGGLIYIGDVFLSAYDTDVSYLYLTTGEDIVIRDGTRIIADGAFNTVYYNKDGSINRYGGFTSLRSITIPASVTTICGDALVNDNKSLIIKGYDGTEAERYAASKGLTFESLGAAPGSSESFWNPLFPSNDNLMFYFSSLVSGPDRLGVLVFIIIILLMFVGLFTGGTKTTTIKTYRGGKLVNVQSYKETSSDVFFGAIVDVISSPAPEIFFTLAVVLAVVDLICAIPLLITVIGNWSSMYIYDELSGLMLAVSIICILLTLAASFMTVKVTKNSLIITIACLVIRLYNLVVSLVEYLVFDNELFSMSDQRRFICFPLVADMLADSQNTYKVLNMTTVIAWLVMILLIILGCFVFDPDRKAKKAKRKR